MTTTALDIAVVGATGTVGESLVQILEEVAFPVSTLHLLASMESAGSSVMFAGKKLKVREVDSFDFTQVQLVFFAASPAVSLSFAPKATAAGCTVIDLSGALDGATALVPEANGERIGELAQPALITSPSAGAVALAVALAPLRGCSISSAYRSTPAWRFRNKAGRRSASSPGRPPNCLTHVRWSRVSSIVR